MKEKPNNGETKTLSRLEVCRRISETPNHAKKNEASRRAFEKGNLEEKDLEFWKSGETIKNQFGSQNATEARRTFETCEATEGGCHYCLAVRPMGRSLANLI
jgi:hypothetical protein